LATINIPNNKGLEARERILLEIRYYNELGETIQASSNAYRLNINIKNSVYLKSTIESYLDNKPFGQGDREEITTDVADTMDIVYTTIIEKEDYGKLSSILLSKLNTEITKLTLMTELPTDITIDEEVIKYILSNFENIYLNFNGMTSWITIPAISVNLKSLIIEFAQIYVTQTIILCESSFTMKNCVLQSKPDLKTRASLLVNIEKDAILNNIKVADRLYVGITGATVKRFDKWEETNVTISEYTIGFKDINGNTKSHNKMYDSLLTIAEISKVYIHGVKSLNDIPYYSLLTVKNSSLTNISEVIRDSVELPALSPTIKLENYTYCNIYQIEYDGVNYSLEKTAFIKLIKARLDSSLTISDASLTKMPIVNLTGIKCNKIAIAKSTFTDNDVILNMDSGYVSNLLLDDVSIKKNNKINMKAASLSITKTDINSKGDIILKIKEKANIINSVLKSRTNINIELENEASLNINKSTLNSIKEINIDTKYDVDNELSSSITFNTSNLLTNNVAINNLRTLNSHNLQLAVGYIKIINCSYCSLQDTAINPKSAIPIAIEIDKVEIRPSNINIYNPLSYNIILSQCVGQLRIAYLDDKNGSASFAKLNLISSEVTVLFDAVTDRGIHLKSDNSLGSVVYSESDTITIVPELDSIDRQHFERIVGDKIHNKVVYGNIIKK
jgi:hypothetical protein